MENDLEKQVYSNNIVEFLTVANDFCNYMDDLSNYNRKSFMERSLKLLPLLYLKASLLPSFKVEVEDELDIEKIVTQEEWQYVNNKVADLMSNLNTYTELTDPLNNESDLPVLANISENFADIYQDMKNFVSLYQIDTVEIMHDAIFECKSNFKNYWGQSLVNVLKALHFIYNNKPLENNFINN